MSDVKSEQLPVVGPEPHWWWSPDASLTETRWPVSCGWGSDEFGRKTAFVRVPWGMLVVALWRFKGWSGPCARCGQWEPTEHWEAPHCNLCAHEVADREAGCICPSFLVSEIDDEWPTPGCPVHKQRGRV